MSNFFIDTSGRWSGGGSVVLSNLLAATVASGGLLTTDAANGAIPVIPRNIPTSWHQLAGPFVWMPQNALPWGPPAPAERALQRKLRMASELVSRRATAMIRISGALPPIAHGQTSLVLHNVLDDAFEDILSLLIPANTNAFVTVGSAHSYRNLALLAQAFAAYRQSGGRTRLVVQMSTGTISEEKLVASLGEQIDGLEVRKGGVDRQGVANLMAGARGVILPSSIEASPVTLLEAQAIGLPLACSDIVAHRELGKSHCMYFKASSTEAIRKVLHQLDDADGVVPHELQDLKSRETQRSAWRSELLSFLASLS
jgi:glycosyltransferase involved in cell wall biosynthesis